MIAEFRKSLNAILFERVTSPLYGAFITSWTIWNWRILYLTFFVSENKISSTKIEYITSNFNDVNHLVWFPLISTLLLIVLIPLVSNGAYWVMLKYKKARIELKQKVEYTQLLSVEKSLEIRSEINRQESRFKEILEAKDEEIALLIATNNEYKASLNHEKGRTAEIDKTFSEEYKQIRLYPGILDAFDSLYSEIEKNEKLPKGIDKKVLEYYKVNGLISVRHDGFRGEVYSVTPVGEKLYWEYYNHKLKNDIK